MKDSRWRGKRIWIIGASAGIGEAVARAFADAGADLVLSARNQDALQALAVSIGGADVIPLDLMERDTLVAAVDQLAAQAPLDAVICTAAYYDPSSVAGLDPERTERLVRVNLLGMIDVARLTPPLLRDGGQLVVFGSVAGYFGLPGGQAYSASKAGINNLAETLRIELAPRVDVRLVCPGFVRTRLTDQNDFNMPFLMEPEEAARRIMSGMNGRGFEIHFPKRLTLALKLLRMLPYPVSLWLTGRIGRSR